MYLIFNFIKLVTYAVFALLSDWNTGKRPFCIYMCINSRSRPDNGSHRCHSRSPFETLFWLAAGKPGRGGQGVCILLSLGNPGVLQCLQWPCSSAYWSDNLSNCSYLPLRGQTVGHHGLHVSMFIRLCFIKTDLPSASACQGGCMGQNLAAQLPGGLGKCSGVLTLLEGLRNGWFLWIQKRRPRSVMQDQSHLVKGDLAGPQILTPSRQSLDAWLCFPEGCGLYRGQEAQRCQWSPSLLLQTQHYRPGGVEGDAASFPTCPCFLVASLSHK